MSEVHVHQLPRRWRKCMVQSNVSWKLFRGIASLKWSEGQGYRIQPSLYPFVYNAHTLKVMCATPDRCSVVLLGFGFHYNCLVKTTEEALVLWTQRAETPCNNSTPLPGLPNFASGSTLQVWHFLKFVLLYKILLCCRFLCQAYYIVNFDYSRFISACFDYLK